jgi:hypothetical protein
VAATRTGRPEKLSAAVQARIVNAIHSGASREKAAQPAGIDRSTLQRCLARGQGPKAQVRFHVACCFHLRFHGADRAGVPVTTGHTKTPP